MKRLLLLFCLIIFKIQAQSYQYKPFLSTTDWRVLLGAQGGTDTYWYHKAFVIQENSKEYVAITDCEGLDPIVYIRENVTTRKVYYMRPDEMKEYLLFDFSLKVGDKTNAPLALSQTYYNEYQVISIDTIDLPDGKHKRFVLRETQNLKQRQFTMVEGIGCLDEPFKIYYRTADPVFYLLNSYIGKTCIYNFLDTGAVNKCYVPTGLHQSSKTNITTYPNPCHDILNITNIDSMNFKIFNTNGQLIMEGKCVNEIEIGNLSEGFYYILFWDANRRSSTNFIKM